MSPDPVSTLSEADRPSEQPPEVARTVLPGVVPSQAEQANQDGAQAGAAVVLASAIEIVQQVSRLLSALQPQALSMMAGVQIPVQVQLPSSQLSRIASEIHSPSSSPSSADFGRTSGAEPVSEGAVWDAAEIAAWARISLWTARYRLMKRPDFPPPVMICGRPRWFAKDILAWAESTKTSPAGGLHVSSAKASAGVLPPADDRSSVPVGGQGAPAPKQARRPGRPRKTVS